MKPKQNNKLYFLHVCAVGFAMFAMFFGAGNIMFPLSLGLEAGANSLWAIFGLLISGVIIPFFGIVVMALFDGDYKLFFGRLGKKVGFFIAFGMMMILGPLSGMPRCITLAATTVQQSLPGMSTLIFISFACIFLYFLAIRKKMIIGIIGYVLTPILLISIVTLVIKGVWTAPAIDTIPDYTKPQAFIEGLKKGYYAIDLIAAIFFAILLIPSLERISGYRYREDPKGVVWVAIKASIIGVVLLGSIYAAFIYLAARHGQALVDIQYDNLLGVMANHIVGKRAGLVTNLIVSLACLTTALSQLVVFASFLNKQITHKKVNYALCIFVTLVVAFAISNLGFWGVINLLAPVLQACYPPLILLCILNLLYKSVKFRPVKIPVLVVFVLSVIAVLI